MAEKYRDRPYDWVTEVLDMYLWSKQREILDSIFTERRTVVRAGNAVGKTLLAATAALAFMYTQVPSIVITIAPTWRQVTDLIWSYINHLFKTKLETKGIRGSIFKHRLNVSEEHFATGISPADEVATQGYHQENMLIIVDEAPGVKPHIIEALDSLITTDNAHVLWIGNPLDPTGHFYNAFKNPAPGVKRFRMSVLDSPNFTEEKKVTPKPVLRKLVGKTWHEDTKRIYGEKSNYYITHVLGEFPKAGDRQLIPIDIVEHAMERIEVPDGDFPLVLGVDVARFGDNSSVFTVCQGYELLDIEILRGKTPTTETAGMVVAMHNTFKFDKIRVDVCGVGGGVFDILNEKELPVYGVDVSSRNVQDKKIHYNVRAETWFNMKDWLALGKIPQKLKGKDDFPTFLMRDLVAPQYEFHSDGTFKIEPKDKTIERLGHSPDFADSAILACLESIGLYERTRFTIPDEDDTEAYEGMKPLTSVPSSGNIEKHLLYGEKSDMPWDRNSIQTYRRF